MRMEINNMNVYGNKAKDKDKVIKIYILIKIFFLLTGTLYYENGNKKYEG